MEKTYNEPVQEDNASINSDESNISSYTPKVKYLSYAKKKKIK